MGAIGTAEGGLQAPGNTIGHAFENTTLVSLYTRMSLLQAHFDALHKDFQREVLFV